MMTFHCLAKKTWCFCWLVEITPQAAVLRSASSSCTTLFQVCFPQGNGGSQMQNGSDLWMMLDFLMLEYQDIATVIFFLLNTWQLFLAIWMGKIMSRHCKLLDWTWLPSGKHVQKTMDQITIFFMGKTVNPLFLWILWPFSIAFCMFTWPASITFRSSFPWFTPLEVLEIGTYCGRNWAELIPWRIHGAGRKMLTWLGVYWWDPWHTI